MNVYRFPLGELQTNAYLLVKDTNCIIIDPADSADFLLEEVQRRNLQLQGIVATHGHFDHLMAVGEIQLSYPHLPLYIHKEDHFLSKRLKETAKYFLGYEPYVIPVQSSIDLQQGELSIGDFTFTVLLTPGHTPGSCSFYFPEDAIIFTGDTLFNGAVGRYDFKYSSKADLRISVKTILELPEEIQIYSGHGEETYIFAEKAKGTLELL